MAMIMHCQEPEIKQEPKIKQEPEPKVKQDPNAARGQRDFDPRLLS